MIARILVKPFGTIWNLQDLCKKKEKGISSLFVKFLYNWYQYEHGSAISYRAIFAGRPILPHGTKQIIITGDVRIGKNCTIFQQVSIQKDFLKSSPTFGSPVVGDNCYIYPGVKIIGKIIIGDNVIIRENTVVSKNISNNSIVSVGEIKVQINEK